MVALWIIGGILLLLILLLLLRVGVHLRFGEQLELTVIAGPARIRLLPRPEKTETEQKTKQKKKAKGEAQEEKEPAKQREKLSLSFEDIRSALPYLWEGLKRALARTRRRMRIDPLRLSVIFAGEDPAAVAQTYGWASSAMWTLMPQLERLLTQVEQCFDLSRLTEYTVEAGRPDTITDDKLRTLRAHGVDRISVNPQTMSDEVLNVIGRRHTAADIVEALEKVRKVGGMEVNMDLIAGLPADSAEGFEKTLDTVIALDPENITVHTLSLKKGSRITLEGSAIPSDAEVGKMLDIAQDKLRRGGWAPYYLYRQKFMSGGFENVGWSKPGSENIYNVCIMEELCSIIALGGGGSTKLISPAGGRNIRFFAPKYPAEYISGIQKTCSDKQGIIDFYSKESKK